MKGEEAFKALAADDPENSPWMLARARECFERLKHKGWDWVSFRAGWIESVGDVLCVLCSDVPKAKPEELIKGIEMISNDERFANKLRFLELLGEAPRAGLPELLVALEEGGFFESPASARFHGCELGGLAAHSLNVFEVLESFVLLTDLDVPRESLVFAALLHDVCKMGKYVESDTAKSGWACDKEHPKGHAVLSIEIVQRFVELSEVEELMIRFHMGVYGLTEFEPERGEFPLRGGGLANAWNKHPVVKLMYFADEIGSLCEQVERCGAAEEGREQRDVASENSEPALLDYQQRVVDDHAELGVKLNTLEQFMQTSVFEVIDAAQRELYIQRRALMEDYYQVLGDLLSNFSDPK